MFGTREGGCRGREEGREREGERERERERERRRIMKVREESSRKGGGVQWFRSRISGALAISNSFQNHRNNWTIIPILVLELVLLGALEWSHHIIDKQNNQQHRYTVNWVYVRKMSNDCEGFVSSVSIGSNIKLGIKLCKIRSELVIRVGIKAKFKAMFEIL